MNEIHSQHLRMIQYLLCVVEVHRWSINILAAFVVVEAYLFFREDTASWIESLLAAKDKFPRLSTVDLTPSENMVISTKKLRSRLSLEGISEEAIKDCESIMLGELAALQNQMKAQLKHMVLLDKLRQLEVIPLFF